MQVEGWTDGRMDMPKVIGTFHDHANTPKKTYPGLKVSENHITIPLHCDVLKDCSASIFWVKQSKKEWSHGKTGCIK